jgi:hypothetical protein
MEKGIVYHNITIPSDDQATIIAQPSECPFDFPPSSVTTQRSSVLGGCFASTSAMRTDQFNSPCGQPGPQRITVVAPVSNQPYGFASGTTRTRAGHSNRTQRFLDESDFRWGRRVQVVSQRKTLAVDHHHPLRPLATLGFPDTVAPFLAGAKLPSAKASLQSSWPRWSSSARKARQAFSHTPCSSHSLSRRQQVEGLGYRWGRSHHGAPVRNTQRIPSKTSRLSIHGRPPRGDGFGLGNNGSIRFQCASDSFHRCLAIEIPPSMTIYHNCTLDTSLFWSN